MFSSLVFTQIKNENNCHYKGISIEMDFKDIVAVFKHLKYLT